MKFPHVPVGQRFLFQGETYVKVGPVTARRERDAETRLIPRSAMVRVPPPDAGSPAASPMPLPDWVLGALDAYEGALRAVLRAPAAGPAPSRARLEAAMAAARRAFQEKLAESVNGRKGP